PLSSQCITSNCDGTGVSCFGSFSAMTRYLMQSVRLYLMMARVESQDIILTNLPIPNISEMHSLNANCWISFLLLLTRENTRVCIHFSPLACDIQEELAKLISPESKNVLDTEAPEW